MGYLFTSESVSEGHPDKVADQISDAVLDELLAFDPSSKVACETMVTTGQVIIAGEVKSQAYVDLQEVARRTIQRIGYTKAEYKFEAESCGVLSAIHEQSADINRGVEREDPMNQGAGDQGMMFGYATNETENFMPLSLDLAHNILLVLAEIRKEGKEMTYLRPDAKSQVTIEYDDQGKPVRVDTIVVSTQHDDFIQPSATLSEEEADRQMLAQIHKDVIEILMPRVIAGIHNPEILKLFNDQITYHVNPTGKFVIGGPHGDTGLTGHLRWQGSTRWRCFLRKRSFKGRPLCRLCRTPYRQEYGSSRCSRRNARTDQLCHRCGRTDQHLCEHLWQEPCKHERRRDCQSRWQIVRPAPESYRRKTEAAQSDL